MGNILWIIIFVLFLLISFVGFIAICKMEYAAIRVKMQTKRKVKKLKRPFEESQNSQKEEFNKKK